MNRPRIVRWLRIAWSVAWGILCVLLIVFWVRSYYFVDNFSFPITDVRFFEIESLRGEVSVFTAEYVTGYYSPKYGRENPWDLRSHEVEWYHRKAQTNPEFRGAFGFGINWSPPLYLVAASHWWCVLIASGVAAVPWIRWRFSYVGACQVWMGFYIFVCRGLGRFIHSAWSLLLRRAERTIRRFYSLGSDLEGASKGAFSYSSSGGLASGP